MTLKRWDRLDRLNLIIFAALVILFYWRILTPNLADRQSFPPGDFSAQFWAFTTFEVRELSAGRLPLWNPYTFAGAPFWADVQSAVFYPPSLLTLLLSTPWGFSLFALEIEAIAHFWLAATFTYLFVRRITGNRPAAFIAALTFTFSGYLTGYPSQQLAVLEADVWLPLILFFIHQAYERRSEGGSRLVDKSANQATKNGPPPAPLLLRSPTLSLLLAGVAWGMTLLAGHPQSGLIVAYISAAYLFFLGLTTPGSIRFMRSTLQAIGHAALFLTTGLALAAIQFLPAVEYTRLSVRAEGAYDRMSGGFPLTDLIQILLPGQVSFYSPLYVGIGGLLLAVWVIFTAAPRRHIVFWGLVAGITLLITLGGNTFLYSPLYLGAPGMSVFRGQERWAFATAFSLAVLAGYGFKQLANMQIVNDKLQTLARLTRYLFLLALLFDFLFFYGLNDAGWTPASPFYGLLGASTLLTILLALAWLLWRFAPRLPAVLFTGLTAALICFDLFTTNWQTNLYPQPPEWHTRRPAVVEAIQNDVATSPSEPFRVYNEFRVYDNYGIPLALEDLWGASPLRPDRYDKFLAPPMPIERAWELLNVKYVITWRETLYVPSTIIYQEPAEDGSTYVHRLAEAGPRAWLVTQAEIAGDAAILQKIADPAFDRWRIALLEPGAEPFSDQLNQTATDNSRSPLPALRYTVHSPNALSVTVSTASPTLLILSETYYPGWQATIDGQPVPLLRADFILRAVPIPAGKHTIELTFRPLSFTIGAIISGLAVIMLVIFLILTYFRPKPREP